MTVPHATLLSERGGIEIHVLIKRLIHCKIYLRKISLCNINPSLSKIKFQNLTKLYLPKQNQNNELRVRWCTGVIIEF